MAVRRIQKRRKRCIRIIIIQKVLIDAISVQCDHGTGFDRIHFPAAACKNASHKTAVILRRIALRLAHLGVFLCRFGRTDRYLKTRFQIVILDRLVNPLLCLPAVSVGNG